MPPGRSSVTDRRHWALRKRNWVPLLVLLIGLVATGLVTRQLGFAIQRGDDERFLNHLQSRQSSIVDRLNNYAALLRGTAGLLTTRPDTTLGEFAAYIAQLDLATRYPGIQGIGFSRTVHTPEAARTLDAQLRRLYGGEIGIWPASPRDEYHAILFLEPHDRRNAAALGYDMYTEPQRRAAMARARDSGVLTASGPVTLVQEIDPRKQQGFLMYLPVYNGGATPASIAERRAQLRGFAYSAFRVGDLFAGIIGGEQHPRVGFELYDGARVDPARLMYRSVAAEALPTLHRTTSTRFDVAGRTWSIRWFSLPAFETTSSRMLLPASAVGGALLSLLFAGVVAQQIRARVHSERLAIEADRRAAEMQALALDNARLYDEQRSASAHRELLIAELDHRVKNTLAIVQSIAQQTRRATASADEFHEAFMGRLHALARTHDLLTREQWQGASLEDILRATLAPYLPSDPGTRLRVAGPRVRLAPAASVSLSMAFHELATNAAKYGALSGNRGRLEVSWDTETRQGEAMLALRWEERDGPPLTPPTRRGFGSRLIAQLGRELGGQMTLEFAHQGLVCQMRFPLATASSSPNPQPAD